MTNTDLMELLVMWAMQQEQSAGRSLGTMRGSGATARPSRAWGSRGGAAPSNAAPQPAAVPLQDVQSGAGGDRLAAAAEQRLNPGDKGKCAKYVRQAMQASGLVPGDVSFGSAHQWADHLAGNSKFREVSVSREQLAQLPRGAVVVWGGEAGNQSDGPRQHGHIAIAKGDGTELSYDNRTQTTNGWGTNFGGTPDPQGRVFRVFIPVE
jgi:hypothetical protein